MCVVQQTDFDAELELSRLVNLDFTDMIIDGFHDANLCGDICLGSEGMLSACLQKKFKSELKSKSVTQLQFDYIEMLSVAELKFSGDSKINLESLFERIEQFNDGAIPENVDENLMHDEESDKNSTKVCCMRNSAQKWEECFDMINLNDLEHEDTRNVSSPTILSTGTISKINHKIVSPRNCGSVSSSENELADRDNREHNISDRNSQQNLTLEMNNNLANADTKISSSNEQKKICLREIRKSHVKQKCEKVCGNKEEALQTQLLASAEMGSSSSLEPESRSKKLISGKLSTSSCSVKSSSSENDFKYSYSDQDLAMIQSQNSYLSSYFQLVNDGLLTEFYYDAIVVGKKNKMWFSPDDFMNNIDWKMTTEFIYPLSALIFPICSVFGSDIVAINSSNLERKMAIVNFTLWAQASRMVRSFEVEQLNSMKVREINLEGPAILIIVPNWTSAQLIEQMYNRRLSSFKSWRPHIVADFGWGNPTKCQHLVTTPARLLENLENGSVNLNRVKLIVMDECDVIFDSFNREIVESMNKFKRSECQRVVTDWRLMLFSKSYHPKIDSFLKIRNWRPEKRIDNISYIFTDLFLGTAFLGVSHVPLICSHKRSEKFQLAKQILKQNCCENSAVVIVCQSEETCLFLTSRLFNEGYNVNCVTDEIKQRMQPELEDSTDPQRKSSLCVTIVITTDSYLDQITDLGIAYNFALFYEGVDNSDMDTEIALNRRCSVLMDTLDGKSIKNPKIFHFISEMETVEYIVLLKSKFESSKSRNNWTYSVERNFKEMLEELFINCEKEKCTNKNNVKLCQQMLLNPQYATHSKQFINCGNLLCSRRHQILSFDQPGSDVKCVKLPTQGYFRVRVRQVKAFHYRSSI